MADTSSLSIYCLLYMTITVIFCDGIRLHGIPTVNYGSRQELTCYQGGWWGKSDTVFRKDTQNFAKVRRRATCSLELSDDSLNKDDFETSCSWTIRKLIIKKVDDRYNNSVWQCNSKGKDSNNYTITVQDLETCSFNASIKGNLGYVVEGNDLMLTCNANTTDNNLDYDWTVYHNNGTTTKYKTRSINKTASRDDTGMYNCHIKKGKDCMSEAQVDVNVQYHPNVSIHTEASNSTINMTCIGDGYPDNFKYYGWQHYINDQLVRVLQGNETRGTSMLLLTQVTAFDNGKYVCLLSNGIKDRDGNSNSSAQSIFGLPSKPVDIGNVTKEMLINIGDDVNITSVYLTDNLTSVTLMAPGGLRTILNVSDVMYKEYMNISAYGSVISTTVTVVQYFIQNVTSDGRYNFEVCNIHNLCVESHGCSIKFTDSRSKQSDMEELSNNLSIIIGTVVAVVVIMVIVIVFICVVFFVRRRSPTFKEMSPNGDQDERFSNSTYGKRNVEIIPNDLYHSSEPNDNNIQMEIIPNDLYDSSDPQNDNVNNVQIDTTPGELYVDRGQIARNKEIQKQINSNHPNQVYMNVNYKPKTTASDA